MDDDHHHQLCAFLILSLPADELIFSFLRLFIFPSCARRKPAHCDVQLKVN